LIKLRTVTVHWVLVVIAIAFPVVITVLVAIFAEIEGAFDSDEVSSLIAGLVVVSAMLLGAMSVVSLTSEFAHDTIRPTFAATPSRVRVIAAKMIVITVVVAVLAAVIVTVCWVAASLILSGRGVDISLGDDGVFGALISVCVHSVIVSWFGFGLGLSIRNSPATVTIFLLWPLLIENLIALLFTLVGSDGATKWLPYAAGITATVADGEPDVLGRPGGLIYFGGIALAIVVLGTLVTDRRDA